MASTHLAQLRRRTPKPIRSLAWRVLTAVRRERPGLLMRYPLRAAPARVEAAPGYTVRAWQPGDDSGWIDLLNASGAFGRWDESRLVMEMDGLVRAAQFFALVAEGGQLVACTGVLARPLAGRPALEIAWVARHPGHAGRKLGLAVVTHAMEAALAQPGAPPLYLYTDDHRLTAIRMYLDLGFVPDLTSHRSYPRRWQGAFLALARRKGPSGSSAAVCE